MIMKPFLSFLIFILMIKCTQVKVVSGHKRWSESKAEQCSSERQEFNECGTACPPTCYLPNPEFCTRECVARCFCKDDYFEALDGRCYTEQECEPIINAPPNIDSYESINYHFTTIKNHQNYEFFEK